MTVFMSRGAADEVEKLNGWFWPNMEPVTAVLSGWTGCSVL